LWFLRDCGAEPVVNIRVPSKKKAHISSND
jgi:hypothetical protein